MESIQIMSIDTEMSFSEILKLPFWMIGSYYDDGAWNIKKEHNKNRAQIRANHEQLMKNIIVTLKGR